MIGRGRLCSQSTRFSRVVSYVGEEALTVLIIYTSYKQQHSKNKGWEARSALNCGISWKDHASSNCKDIVQHFGKSKGHIICLQTCLKLTNNLVISLFLIHKKSIKTNRSFIGRRRRKLLPQRNSPAHSACKTTTPCFFKRDITYNEI